MDVLFAVVPERADTVIEVLILTSFTLAILCLALRRRALAVIRHPDE